MKFVAIAETTTQDTDYKNRPVTFRHFTCRQAASPAAAEAFFPELLALIETKGDAPPSTRIERVKYKKRPSLVTRIRKSDAAWEQTAITYARWFANRDGITLPANCKVRVIWSSVYNDHKKHHENRIRAVEWGNEHEIYDTPKDGRPGAWLYDEFKAVLTVELPHWDFIAMPPVEEILSC